jgi:hypothetical protein
VAEETTIHRLKVTLRHVKPPVWRRIEVSSDVKLSKLAAILEAGMGWLGGHLHAFEQGDVRYEVPDAEWGADVWFGRRVADERKARLGDVLPTIKSRMRWEYDFGDGWEHDVLVEAIERPTAGRRYPVCLTGRRACPPEDCGGPWGYDDMLTAMRDPLHENHAFVVDWLPVDFDPEQFDADIATENMRSPRPLYDWR